MNLGYLQVGKCQPGSRNGLRLIQGTVALSLFGYYIEFPVRKWQR